MTSRNRFRRLGCSGGAALAFAMALTLTAPALAQDCNGNNTDDSLELAMPTALHLADVDDVAITGFNGTFPDSAFTVSMWLRPMDGPHGGIFSYAAEGGSANALLLYNADNLQIYIGGQSINTGINLPDGEWHHLAVTFFDNGGNPHVPNVHVYVDATQVSSWVVTSSPGSSGTLVLGEDQDLPGGGGFDPAQAFIGMYRDVRLYSVVRSAAEIAADYATPLTGDEPNLVAYWPMQEAAGTSVTDLAGPHHFALFNGVAWASVDQNGDGILDDCTGPVHNFTQNTVHDTVQGAIDAAVHGDEVIVYPGEFTETIDFLGKAITLRSIMPTDPDVVASTIINGNGAPRVVQFVSGEGPDTVLSGFTIAGGNAPAFPESTGGGLYCVDSSPTISHCTFSNNTAALAGGGAYADPGSAPAFSHCLFSGNTAEAGGGGLVCSGGTTITDCQFVANQAVKGSGGGATFFGPCTITNCAFIDNSSWLPGGGAECTNDGGTPSITGTSFCWNTPQAISGPYTDDGGNALDCTSSDGSSGPAGACCLADGCVITTEGDCATAGGTYLGDDSACDGSCPGVDPVGACCLGDACVVITEADCLTADGTYQGDASDCRSAACPQPCPADVTGDGLIDVADLLDLLSAWGVCR